MKIRVTAKNYSQEVLDSRLPVLVEFFAIWCGKCAMMADIMDEIAREYEGKLKVCQVEIEECELLVAEFQIEIVPTFVIFRLGEPVAAASGILNKEILVDMIEKIN